MKEIKHIRTAKGLTNELGRLREKKRKQKYKLKRSYSLTPKQRSEILKKTDSKCHICGRKLDKKSFEADHVKSHSSGGSSKTENFLAACRLCNNYRWNYISDELQWILKIGIWARTQIINDTKIGSELAVQFIKRERVRENRRKEPRI